MREAETDKLEMENTILAKELYKLDELADIIKIRITSDDFELGINLTNFAVTPQNAHSNKIAKHQEKAELPKRDIPMLDRDDITH